MIVCDSHSNCHASLPGYFKCWDAGGRLVGRHSAVLLGEHAVLDRHPALHQLVALALDVLLHLRHVPAREQQLYRPLQHLRKQRILSGRQEGRKEMFYLNDALNTFHLWLNGVRHMVEDQSDRERGYTLPPHGLLFPISSKGSFICIIPQTGNKGCGILSVGWCI